MSRYRTIILVILSVLLLILTLRGQIGNFSDRTLLMKSADNPSFESPHERSSFVLMQSILQDHSVSLDSDFADFGFNDVGMYKGKLYSLFPPGVAVIVLPFYLLGSLFGLGQLFTILFVELLSLFTAFILYKILKEDCNLPSWAAIISAIVFLFGTTAWSYSVALYQHMFTTFLIVAGYHVVNKYQKSGKKMWLVLGSFAYLVSGFFDYTNLVLLFPLVVYIFFVLRTQPDSKKKAYLVSLGLVLIGFGIMALYNTVVFGDWKVMSNPLPVYRLAENISGSDAATSMAIHRFGLEKLPYGLYSLLISPRNGVFILSPVLILGLLFVVRSVKRKTLFKNPALLYCLGILVINICMYAVFDDPWGGMAYGSRYLVPGMACLSLCVGMWLGEEGKMSRRNKKVTAFILLSISGFVALLGAVVTNMIPYVDPVYTGVIPDGVMYNLHGLFDGRIGSFFYHQFLAGLLSPFSYFIVIYLVLLAVFLLIFEFDSAS